MIFVQQTRKLIASTFPFPLIIKFNLLDVTVFNIIENEDSSLLECDAISISERFPTFQRTAAFSPPRVERPMKNEYMGLSFVKGEGTTLLQNATSHSPNATSHHRRPASSTTPL